MQIRFLADVCVVCPYVRHVIQRSIGGVDSEQLILHEITHVMYCISRMHRMQSRKCSDTAGLLCFVHSKESTRTHRAVALACAIGYRNGAALDESTVSV